MDERMSRGEMIRRLDEMSIEVHQRMQTARSPQTSSTPCPAALERLPPIVADELQDVEDAKQQPSCSANGAPRTRYLDRFVGSGLEPRRAARA
jgi:hypothetical protein